MRLMAIAGAVALFSAGGALADPAPAAPAAPAPAATAPLGSPEHPIPQNSPTPADQAYHLKAGDPTVVSNPPIPDTPDARAKDGRPLSHLGRRSAPKGN